MLPTINRLLYCTDLSKNAAHAFEYAVYLAKMTGANIYILSVVGTLSRDEIFAMETYVMDEKNRDEFLNHRINHTRSHLEEQQTYFWEEVAPSENAMREKIKTIDIAESYPAKEILQKARELQCDLIVMGAHEKGVMHSILGSVAKEVLSQSKIPTLIVPLPE